jgi:hypothetical protein
MNGIEQGASPPRKRPDWRAFAGALALLTSPALAQEVPPQAIEQLRHVVGDRVEAVTILGADDGAARGIYSFSGGILADLDITKLGGRGDVAQPRPLGSGGMRWAPVLLGNVGWISADNEFPDGYLKGNRVLYKTFAVQVGGGVRFYLTDHASLAPVVGGIYGHTENDFKAENGVGEMFETAAAGRYVDWQTDTWSVAPAVEFRYEWTRGRVRLEFTSRYSYFHTESFNSSSSFIHVDGDSHTWQNRLGVEAPLGLHLFGREVESGGFLTRTELSGGAAGGLNANYAWTANGRLVLDFTGKLWKTRWLGIGASYFRGAHFSGWSAGLDLRFQL